MFHTEAESCDADVLRQHAAAVACQQAFESATEHAQRYRGGMLWKRVKGHDYLVRTSRIGRQTGMGRRSPETQAQFDAFHRDKAASAAHLGTLKQALARHERLNRALRVGRAPSALIDALQSARSALGDAACVVGDAALLAFESAAGVRFDAALLGLLSTHAQRQHPLPVTLAIDEAAARPDALVGLSIGGAGVVVDWLTRRPMSRTPAEFWADPDRDIQWLANAPRCSEVVVGRNGRMARMPTVDPRALVLHKDWLLRQGTAQVRDIAIGQALEWVVTNRLPRFDFRDLPH